MNITSLDLVVLTVSDHALYVLSTVNLLSHLCERRLSHIIKDGHSARRVSLLLQMLDMKNIRLHLITVSGRVFQSNNILYEHFPAVTQSPRPQRKNTLESGFSLSFILTHGEENNSSAPEAADRMRGDVSGPACKHLIYGLMCLCCTSIKYAID